MGKLVVLKIVDGSFDRGFTVMLQVGKEGARPTIEMTGRLPALPELPLYYSRWQESYGRLDSRYRIIAKRGQKPNVSLVADCLQAATILKARLNGWLQAEEFRQVRERWLEQLSPEEDIRIILQTEDSQLRQLPWNLLDFLDRYPKAEIALSALNTDPPPESRSPLKSNVHILSVLGNSEGIDTGADRALLETLPNAAVTSLVEPDRKLLIDRLWDHPWDILFFAGHSASHSSRETGRIFLNKSDSLTISELKYALRKSVQNGLRLAIFNSCDGLGLARELADLRIPQIIVMREPVPDRVAQEFLKSFLTAYANGAPLYLAVREARERLQGLEHHFPCATWLPLICQHPAVTPPTWQDFTQPEPLPPLEPISARRKLAIALLVSFIITGLVGGVRLLGWLQPLELVAYDHLLRSRPPEPADTRITVVTIDSEDLKQQAGDLRGASISEGNLAKLLDILAQYQPSAIGLDIYRDTAAKSTQLSTQLQTTQNLIATCKVGDEANPPGVKQPPEIPPGSDRVGFTNFVLDSGEVVRRHLIGMNSAWFKNSACQVSFALSTELALRYLQPYLASDTGVDPAWNQNFKIALRANPDQLTQIPHGYYKAADWKLSGQVMFPNLRPRQGGYQKFDAAGNQILLNYRSVRNPEDVALHKPLRWFISNQNPPAPQEFDRLIRGKVVLIGVTAKEKHDYFKTPYGSDPDNQTPGVFVHAHMLSQILSAVLDGRPLIWTWLPWLDWLWIGGWATVGGLLSWRLCLRRQSRNQLLSQLVLAIGVSTGVLYGVCAGVLIALAGWVPFVPAAIALSATSTSVTLWLSPASRRSRNRPPIPPSSGELQ